MVSFGPILLFLPSQFNPNQRTASFDDLTQNQRLQAEVAMIERVRGVKRKREAGVQLSR